MEKNTVILGRDVYDHLRECQKIVNSQTSLLVQFNNNQWGNLYTEDKAVIKLNDKITELQANIKEIKKCAEKEIKKLKEAIRNEVQIKVNPPSAKPYKKSFWRYFNSRIEQKIKCHHCDYEAKLIETIRHYECNKCENISLV